VEIDGERFDPGGDYPFVAQELVETLYHVLWELVHVFLDHARASTSDSGAASFLYDAEPDIGAVVADVRASVLMKAEEIGALREQTLGDGAETLRAAAGELRARLDAGGTLLALGNGGSATDAMDAVADFREPPHGWPARRAIDLAEDPAIITAIANDVGVEAIFLRQVIAYGGPGDALLALSTSGNSANVIAALAEARRRGLMTIAMVGYDGGRVSEDALADHVVVTRSQHIPRIQEAQASAYHVLRELVEA
jgi:D-sedoheptulose 7-phosphate isomerase